MVQYFRQRTILAKIEATEGTDPVPTGAANAVVCGNITVTPLAGSTVARPLSWPSFGATPKVHVGKMVQVQFDTELAGSGAAGTAPAWGALARGCGLSETIVASTSVTYAPISASQESVAIYANESGTLHKLVGARGTCSLMFSKDDVPHIRWTFTGRWTIPAAGALPSLTTTAWIDPLAVNKANTPTFTVDGYAAVLENQQIDLGNLVVFRDRPNAAYVAIADRQVTGSMVIESPALGTKDFFATAYGNTLVARSLVHGTVAGNIITIAEPKLQLFQPSYTELDGIRGLSMNTQSNRNAGNDELTIALT